MKASELESKHQAPSDCEARCAELGMRMGAFVLVSDTLPGCVCQPKPSPGEAHKPGAGEAPKASPSEEPKSSPSEEPKSSPSDLPKVDGAQPGASAPVTSDLAVMVAGVATRVSQTQQQKKEQQNYIPK